MEFLRELHMAAFNQQQDLQLQLDDLKHQYYNILDTMEKMLSEATDLSFSRQNTTLPDLEQNLEQLAKMLLAAGRGLGMANKLPGEQGKKHRAAVMSNLNRIRHRLSVLAKELEHYMGPGQDPFAPTPQISEPSAQPAPAAQRRFA